jgi:hypothetical protein
VVKNGFLRHYYLENHHSYDLYPHEFGICPHRMLDKSSKRVLPLCVCKLLPKSYLFPIPNEEYKKDPDLGQNPGWEIKTTGDSATVQ